MHSQRHNIQKNRQIEIEEATPEIGENSNLRTPGHTSPMQLQPSGHFLEVSAFHPEVHPINNGVADKEPSRSMIIQPMSFIDHDLQIEEIKVGGDSSLNERS